MQEILPDQITAFWGQSMRMWSLPQVIASIPFSS